MNLESKCVEKYAGNDIELLDTHGVLHLGSFPFLFDIEDLPIIKSHIWYRDKDGYLVSCYYYNGQQRFVRFHRIVMHAQAGQFVDHQKLVRFAINRYAPQIPSLWRATFAACVKIQRVKTQAQRDTGVFLSGMALDSARDE